MHLETQWVVGFVDGEGCFHVSVNKHASMVLGYQVLPEFTVVQHERDVKLLHGLKDYFDCGVVRKNNGNCMAYRVRSLDHLSNKIIPFFEKHPLKTVKNIEFHKFKRVVLLMERGAHLDSSGLDEIRGIVAKMNRKSAV